MKNSEQPINPMPHVNKDGTVQHDVYFGLTKREYFAGLNVAALLSNRDWADDDELVNKAIKNADELLKQLEKPQTT